MCRHRMGGLWLTCALPQWHELAQVYLELGQFAEAGFCFEELVVLEPLNDVWHTLLGEVCVGSMHCVALLARAVPRSSALACSLPRPHNGTCAHVGLVATTVLADDGRHGPPRCRQCCPSSQALQSSG